MLLDPFQQKVFSFVLQHQLVDPDDHLLLAVSGGPDSTALLDVVASLQESLKYGRLTVLHFDHKLRGDASAGDKAFVQSLAERLGLPFYSESEDVHAYQAVHGVSLEMAARACRHRFFQSTLERLNAQKVALGHTADDQAEEVLLRLFRGTGPSGLAGMLPRTRNGIIRPLLLTTRREILDYLDRRGLSFREDSSNCEPFCQRNALRLQIFPLIEEHFHSRLTEVLYRHTELVWDEEAFWDSQVEACQPSVCMEEGSDRVVLKLSAFLALHKALQRRVIRSAIERLRGNLLGFYSVHVEIIRKWAVETASGKTLELPAALWALREGEHLVFTKASPFKSEPFHWPILDFGSYSFPGFKVNIHFRDRIPGEPEAVCSQTGEVSCVYEMDADKVLWPLAVRSWNPGDRFRPLGLHGSKKLQDFFTDSKISRTERARVPLLCDQEKICAVLGRRMDDRVKITPETKRLLVVEFCVIAST